MRIHRWRDVRKRRLTETELREADAKVEAELEAMGLRKVRVKLVAKITSRLLKK